MERDTCLQDELSPNYCFANDGFEHDNLDI